MAALQEEYGDQLNYHYHPVDTDATGEAIFNEMELPGHPAVILLDADGNVRAYGFGVIPSETIQSTIDSLL